MASLKSTVKLASNGLCAKGTSRHSELLKIALQALPSIISMMPSLWSHFWPIFLQYLAFSLIFGLSQTCWVSLNGTKTRRALRFALDLVTFMVMKLVVDNISYYHHHVI